RDFVNDLLKDLSGSLPRARRKKPFEALLTPQFTLNILRLDDSVGTGNQDVAIFELKSHRIVRRIPEHSDRSASGLQPEHSALSMLAANDNGRVLSRVNVR